MIAVILARLSAFHRSFTVREKVIYGSLVFLTLSVAYIMYHTLIPTTVLEMRQRHTLPIIGVGGEGQQRSVIYRLDYCKYEALTSTAFRSLHQVDAPILITLNSSGFNLPTGCHVIDIVEPMPPYVPAGRYLLRVVFSYRGNTITRPAYFETDVFELQ